MAVFLLSAALVCPPLHAQTTVAGFPPGNFRVTESGAASYSIPLRVPPGIAGMEPKLALAYSSQGGNGLLGMGGGLQGLSVIHLCGRSIIQDGARSGIQYEATDKFCLDGQRLVLVAGTYGADGAEYRTERESFTRIVSYGTAGSGPSWFKAWTKSGQVLEFGNTPDSRIEAQGKSSVRVWALNKASDTSGNYLAVSYNEDNANGDYSPARIDYTGNGANPPSASVRFSYESRTDNQPIYVGMSLIKLMTRMTNVKTYIGETAVTDCRLAYDYAPEDGPSRLLSVTECTGDGTQCLASTTLSWQNATAGSFPSSSWSSQAGQLADINGDGMADLVSASGGNVLVRYSTGTEFGSAFNVGAVPIVGEGWSEAGGTVYYYAAVLVGDLNGDGRADIWFTNGTALISTPTGFTSVTWPGNSAGGQLADVNGDGMADLVSAPDGSAFVRYSTGTGFGSAVNMGAVPVVGEGWSEAGGTVYYYAVALAGDIDGNGRADIAFSNNTALLSTASGFSSVSWPGNTSNPGHTGMQLADVNGDGMADLVHAAGNGVHARVSTGAGFSGAGYIGALPVVGTGWNEQQGTFDIYASVSVGDADGNGRADFVFSSGTALLSIAQVPNLVTAITSGLDLATTILYKPLTDGAVYAQDSNAVWPVRDLKRQGPLQVVSSVSVPNLVGGNAVTEYFYRGAKAHLLGGGFLGFRQVEATDNSTGIKTVATARQDYPYHGLPIQSVRKQSSGTVIAQSDSSYTDTVLTPAAGSGGKYHKVELTQAINRNYELTGALTVKATTATSYDSFGNATSITVSTAVNESTADGYSKATTNTYTNDTTNWFLGRLTRSTVQSTIP